MLILRGNYYRLIGANSDLYKRRAAICSMCPLNSKNKKLTLSEKVWRFLVGDFCTDCSCPLKSKLVEPLSECPQMKWGQELKPTENEEGQRLES